MFFGLLIIFTTVPIIEFFLLIELGKAFGTWPTIALILGTGLAGAYLARAQGFSTISRIRQEFARGALPSREICKGVCVLSGGVLLLAPGLLTDLSGLLLLFPPIQDLLFRFIRRKLHLMVRTRMNRDETFFIKVDSIEEEKEER